MNGIDLLVEEHKYIKRMLVVLRKASYKILQGEDICYDDFDKMIDFVKNYADQHHHGKEEKILFNRMVEEIGGLADKLITHGMLVEHNMGRLYMQQLKEALMRLQAGDDESKIDIIANAVSYADLLNRHIDREDSTVYTFANRSLCKETLETIDTECDAFEREMHKNSIQEKYLNILTELEEKYVL